MTHDRTRKVTKPRTPLHVLIERWHKSDARQRRIIQINWPRSVNGFLRALLDEAPDGLTRPTEVNRIVFKMEDEAYAYHRQPFGVGNPYGLSRKEAERKHEADVAKEFHWGLASGAFRWTAGRTPATSPRFRVCFAGLIILAAYRQAWALREKESGPDARRGPLPPATTRMPNDTWTAADWEEMLSTELQESANRIDNAATMAAEGIPFTPYYGTGPTTLKLFDGLEPMPDPGPGLQAAAHPVGENGRPMARRIYQDENGELLCRMEEATEEEAEEILRKRRREPKVYPSYYSTPGISAREAIRPVLTGTPGEAWIEKYSDEVITYFTDEDYGKPGHDHTIEERRRQAILDRG